MCVCERERERESVRRHEVLTTLVLHYRASEVLKRRPRRDLRLEAFKGIIKMSVRTNACVFAFLCCQGASGAKGLSRQPCAPLECVVSLPGPVSTGCNSEVVSEAVALAFLTSTNDNVCAKIEVNRMRLIPPIARLHMLAPFSCTKQCELTQPWRDASCTPTERM